MSKYIQTDQEPHYMQFLYRKNVKILFQSTYDMTICTDVA